MPALVHREAIEDLARRIAEEFQPERIILFGSYAYGTPTPDSDVDLLVIMPFEGRATQKAVDILMRTDPQFPIDLLVRTSDQVRQRIEWNDFFIKEATTQGKVLYAAGDD